MASEIDRIRTYAGAGTSRLILLLLCALAFAAVVSFAVSASYRGTTGIIVESTSPDFVDHIVVAPHSPAARSGLRTGDVVYRGLADQVTRYRLSTGYSVAGSPLYLPVMRKGQIAHVMVTPSHQPITWTFWIVLIGLTWLLAFAVLLSIRRPNDPEARLLAGFLIAFVISGAAAPIVFRTQWPSVDAAIAILDAFLTFLSQALLVRYTMLFACPPRPMRKVIARITYAVCLLGALWEMAGTTGAWFGTVDPNGLFLGAVIPNLVLDVAGWGFPVICAVLAVGAAAATERQRLIWSSAPISISFLSFIAINLLYQFFPTSGALPIVQRVVDLLAFVMPVALTYALLSRRLLDVGFALNRAAVFAATSLLLAGLFAGLQMAATTLLAGVSQAHSFLVHIVIAVTVYFVVRLSRQQTDQIVSGIFFAKRQRRIASIRGLIHSVDDVSDTAGVIPFVRASLADRAEIETRVFLPRHDGAFAPVEEDTDTPVLGRDNPTIVMLRSQREPLPAAALAGPGATAFPMLVRGRLRGVLVCRPFDGTELAPDESAVLDTLAREMAVARDDLLAESLRNRFTEEAVGQTFSP